MRSADEQKRDRTTNLHCSKLSPYSQTSNVGSFHRSNSALRQTITLCKTWIRDQYPSGRHPILVEFLVDASEGSVESSATQATIASHLKKSNLVVEMVMEMKKPESIHMAGQCEPGIAFISQRANNNRPRSFTNS